MHYRPVVPGGAGGAMAPPDFGRPVNPISAKGGRLFPPNNTGTPGFSDLPTALHYHSSIVLSTSKWGLAPTNNNSRTVEPLEIKGFPLQILQYVR